MPADKKRGFLSDSRGQAHITTKSHSTERTQMQRHRRVARRVTPADSKHHAYAAHVTITLNPGRYNIRPATWWPETARMLMGQTVLVKTH